MLAFPRRGFLLVLLGVLQFTLAAACLIFALLWPIEKHLPVASVVGAPVPSEAQVGEREASTPIDFSPFANHRFQRPLFDPPPPPPPEPEAKPPPDPPSIQLIATMIEPGSQQAMVRNAQGKTVIIGVGDRVAGGRGLATVISIARHDLTVSYADLEFVIKLK